MYVSPIEIEATAIAMSRALKDLPDLSLSISSTRMHRYVGAGIAKSAASELDHEALSRERLRRVVFACENNA